MRGKNTFTPLVTAESTFSEVNMPRRTPESYWNRPNLSHWSFIERCFLNERRQYERLQNRHEFALLLLEPRFVERVEVLEDDGYDIVVWNEHFPMVVGEIEKIIRKQQ